MRALIASAAIVCLASAAQAEFADRAAEAESLLRSGEADAAFEALEAAVDAFWSDAPLTIAKARIETDGAAATVAVPRSNPTVAPAGHMAVYVEPLGYGFDEDDGEFRIGLSTDIEIRTPGGLILAKSDDFGRLEWAGRVKNRAFSGRINIAMPELRSGDYELLITLTDDASQKKARVTLPFTIAAE